MFLRKMVKKFTQNTPKKERETSQQGSAAVNSLNRSHVGDRSLLNPNLNQEAQGSHGNTMEETVSNDENRRVEYLEIPVKSETDKKDYRLETLIHNVHLLHCNFFFIFTSNFMYEKHITILMTSFSLVAVYMLQNILRLL